MPIYFIFFKLNRMTSWCNEGFVMIGQQVNRKRRQSWLALSSKISEKYFKPGISRLKLRYCLNSRLSELLILLS